jgi:NAD(P)-dependent dehydrogenase (short-subunit alcohol dehydrogenase family)
VTAVLITGATSGIGRATAVRLARRGDMVVYATGRNVAALADLDAANCRVLPLDVTDEESMAAAVRAVEAEHGQVNILINNAGYGEFGTIEQADLNRVRAQFETNVFGLARLTQLVLPGMRRAGKGRVINVSSVGGRLTFPVGGYYHASKYAVEAISDALRFEVRPFGIDVSIIEPGAIRTGFEAAASKTLASAPAGPYQALSDDMEAAVGRLYTNPLVSAEPDAVAKVIERAATARRPATRYVVTAAARLLVHTRRLLGGRAFDALNRLQLRLIGA